MKRHKKLVDERRNQLLFELSISPNIKVDELAQRLRVSPLTVRRDLQFWEDKERISRHYGGATLIETFQQSCNVNDIKELRKNAIAKKAAEFVDDGDTIFVNTSSTALLILKYIKHKRVNVITNNANAIFIQKDNLISVLLTGGELREPKESMVGEFAYNNLSRVSANKAFIGCSGISAQVGMTTAVLAEVAINEVMLRQCTGPRFVLADSTKVGHNHSFVSSSINKIDYLITDNAASEEYLVQLRDKNVKIIQVEVEPI
jgi:DeoR family transcriptional regulator, fructose operon transcriptional repressor